MNLDVTKCCLYEMSISLHLPIFGVVVTNVTALFYWLFFFKSFGYDLVGHRQPHLNLAGIRFPDVTLTSLHADATFVAFRGF